jgi:hypothetical protein
VRNVVHIAVPRPLERPGRDGSDSGDDRGAAPGDVPRGTLRQIEKDLAPVFGERVVTTMSTYEVIVTREGDAWLADVPAMAGTHTWAKNLPGLDRNLREAIALAEDLPEGAEGELDLSYEYHTGDPDLDAQTAAVRAERAQLNSAEQNLTERTALLADRIVHQRGMSVRDCATLLRVSPQRVSQVAPTRTRRQAG